MTDRAATTGRFSSVYGPVESWRYGRSLGIDPIGAVSTCSFDCVYCQLGAIEVKTRERRVFVATSAILDDLKAFDPAGVDAITLSGSGEPTLALNLGEILAGIKALMATRVGVLTNASLLDDPVVREELARADFVAVKLDAATETRFHRVDRPVAGIGLDGIRRGLLQFRRQFTGQLAVQTMLLGAWSEREQAQYVAFVREVGADEIQICTPTRPRPRAHELDARGLRPGETPAYPLRHLELVNPDVLRDFGARLRRETGLTVRDPSSQGLQRRTD
jgi:wyosine [tRNA(Phe)-imidazoG37] synthetase (radical SAM superfamily)